MRGGLEPFVGRPSNPGRSPVMLNETTIALCRDAKCHDAIIAYAILRCMRMDEWMLMHWKSKVELVKFGELVPAMSEWNQGPSFMMESA